MRPGKAMRIGAMIVLAAGLVWAVDEKGGAPYMKAVEPETAKPGVVVKVLGDYLDKSRVAEVYMTKGNTDLKVEIVEQTPEFIRFKVPAEATPGRYGLMFLTAGPDPKLLEQPVHLLVE
jgi:hypothetical protein